SFQGEEASRTSDQPRHIKNSRCRERLEILKGRHIIILFVLSSPALVYGLMVARAKNRVHSILFPILVFRDTLGLLLFIRSRLLCYDLSSSSYRSYSRFIPIHCYDIPYSNSEDS
ncbi:hypothetical protein Godav_017782, partial [Gossypium davidsonii]|nr:hypothetical protein [Gossypium davidsonii]